MVTNNVRNPFVLDAKIFDIIENMKSRVEASKNTQDKKGDALVRICNESKKDIDQILDLYKQAGWSDGAEAGCAIGIGEKQPGEYLLVNEIDGRIVATAQLNIIPSYAHLGTPYAIVNYVVTDENERRKGYMAEIFDRIETICTEHNCSSILLDSAEWRTEAHKFYESMGYESMKGFRKQRKQF